MALTYLDIVNRAIGEAKLTLDPLTSSDFANPPRTRLYDDIKRWVNVAYRDTLARRKELFSRVERATIYTWPRIQVSGLTYIPSVDDVLESADSETRFTVKRRTTAEDDENSSEVEYTLEVEFDTAYTPAEYLRIGESLHRVSPSPALNVGYVKGQGYIKLQDEVPGLLYPKEDTFTLSSMDPSYGQAPLPIPVWGIQEPEDSVIGWSAGYPTCLYKTPQGTYRLNQYTNKLLKLSFSYTKKMPELVDYDDIPTELPEHFHELLVWKTVVEIADFNGDTRLFARANKRVESFTNWQDRDELPSPFLDVYRFDGHTGSY